MSARAAARLAWVLGVLSSSLFAAGIGLYPAAAASDVLLRIFTFAIVVVFSMVGGLIASPQPRNPIGWIFCGVAFVSGLATVADAYAHYRLEGRGGVQAPAELAAWFQSLSWVPTVLVPLTFLLLLFPDGRLLSPRWRSVAWCAAIGIAGTFAGIGVTPGRLDDFAQLDNPVAVHNDRLVLAVVVVSVLLLAVALIGSPIALYLRFRRATPEQRLQTKWLVWAGGVATATLLGIAAATGVAILRYRLYEIDVVIHRTLVYGALTAALGATYLASALMLQLVLSPSSDLAVAVSTLAVAAAFRPARARIQAGVDRRFYRRRYNARLTLEAFGAATRRGRAGRAQRRASRRRHPDDAAVHVSLWLRPPAVTR